MGAAVYGDNGMVGKGQGHSEGVWDVGPPRFSLCIILLKQDQSFNQIPASTNGS